MQSKLFILGRNIKATGGYFLLGILLSALFQRYVPADTFGNLFQEQKGFGVLMAATKITNLGALKIVLGLPRFILYFAYIILFSFLTGMLIECF